MAAPPNTARGLVVLLSLLASTSSVLVTSAVLAQEGDVPPGGTDATYQVVPVQATDFKYDPDRITVQAGAVSFGVRNVGVIEHDFGIENAQRARVAGTAPLPPGQSFQLDVTLTEGTYTLVCSLIGHREAGMTGTLTVTP